MRFLFLPVILDPEGVLTLCWGVDDVVSDEVGTGDGDVVSDEEGPAGGFDVVSDDDSTCAWKGFDWHSSTPSSIEADTLLGSSNVSFDSSTNSTLSSVGSLEVSRVTVGQVAGR